MDRKYAEAVASDQRCAELAPGDERVTSRVCISRGNGKKFQKQWLQRQWLSEWRANVRTRRLWLLAEMWRGQRSRDDCEQAR